MNIILIHGGWHGGWDWRETADWLRDHGHAVFTPSLTGLGEREHLLTRDTNMTTHVVDVMNLVRYEELADVILVGHSYGGVVARAVADRIPDKIAGVIYLDAFIPENGLSMLELMPIERSTRHRRETVYPNGIAVVRPYPIAESLMTDPDVIERMDRRQNLHPLATFDEKWIATRPDHTPKQGFIRCLKSGSPNLKANYERAKREGWPNAEMDCGHNAMLILPERTGELIEEMGLKLSRR